MSIEEEILQASEQFYAALRPGTTEFYGIMARACEEIDSILSQATAIIVSSLGDVVDIAVITSHKPLNQVAMDPESGIPTIVPHFEGQNASLSHRVHTTRPASSAQNRRSESGVIATTMPAGDGS
jgi:hypothetical protein